MFHSPRHFMQVFHLPRHFVQVLLQVIHKLQDFLVVGFAVFHQNVEQRQLRVVGFGQDELVQGADSESYGIARAASLRGKRGIRRRVDK